VARAAADATLAHGGVPDDVADAADGAVAKSASTAGVSSAAKSALAHGESSAEASKVAADANKGIGGSTSDVAKAAGKAAAVVAMTERKSQSEVA